jgi:hypothetical protein
MLSIILTTSVLFPDITETQILYVLIGGVVIACLTTVAARTCERRRAIPNTAAESLDVSLGVSSQLRRRATIRVDVSR